MEDAESPESGATDAAGVDPFAAAIALGGASRQEADAFLKDQRALIADQQHLVKLQAKELAHELKLRHWSLQLRHASAILKFAFEISLALIAFAVAGFIGATVWSAAHDEGLVIESFSVPPDMAGRGLTGQVVATQMLDNLSSLQAQSNSVRALSTYANNWGDDIKVEIPETGVSLGELNRYLHQLLGHQTHITGEVVHTATGIAVTARTGIDSGQRYSGADSDFDSLLQQATEAVYRRTQPYRYGVYLFTLGKISEARAFFTQEAATGSPAERAWANIGLTNTFTVQDRMQENADAANASVRLNPDFAFGWVKVAGTTEALGQAEASLAADRRVLRLLPAAQDLQSAAIALQQHAVAASTDRLVGDYADERRQLLETYPGLDVSAPAGRQVQQILSSPGPTLQGALSFAGNYGNALAYEHALAAAGHALSQAPAFATAIQDAAAARHDIRGARVAETAIATFRALDLSIALQAEDWRHILQIAPVLDAQMARLDAQFAGGGSYPPTTIWPLWAYAEAMTGDFKAAHAQIDQTPGDCDLCLRMRAKIDAAQKNYGGAVFWFARAAQIAPSIPFAYADWGQMLLDRGDAAGAIAQFKLANQKGPHFADPLEMWGEALMAQNRSDLALAKFTEAEKYAPNWGRLHLKWGEALGYAGKKDEAQKQFSRAAALDLTAAEKSELAKVDGHV